MARLLQYEEAVRLLASRSGLPHLLKVPIYVISSSSRSKAYARIWGMPKPLQEALGVGPLYVVELLEPYWRLDCMEKAKVLAHELAHIPRTASGALRPHNSAFRRDYKAIAKGAEEACRVIREADRRGMPSP
ncbi:MAG: putative metallopeptidase [Thermoproteus sp.]